MIKSLLSQKNGSVLVNGAQLDVESWTCLPSAPEFDAKDISALEFFTNASETKAFHHLVIGVIGPRDATEQQLAAAEKIGNTLGGLGLTLICGGKGGVMEAASKGCNEAGGVMIGILPGSVPSDANPYVSIPIPTGLGEARNMIIAKAARVLVAVGGSYGTLSEVAYGLHFSKSVIGVEGAADVEGVLHAKTAEKAVDLALEALLASAPMAENDTTCKHSNMVSS